MVMFDDGTIEVSLRENEEMKVYRLRPKNPVMMLLPLFSSLALAMGSDIVLKQRIRSLFHEMETQYR